MMKNLKIGALTCALLAGGMLQAQLKVPVKSPSASVKQAFALTEVSVEYARPSKRDRVVFGDVVPFGEVWRTGANASTKVTVKDEVMVNGQALKAGTYSLFTIPEQNQWTIIFNTNTELWGSNGYKPEQDALRIVVKPTALAETVETLTIQFSAIDLTEMSMDILWDKTKVSLKFTSEVEAQVMKEIDEIMSTDKRPYHQAANFYYDNKKDLKKALEWATKAVELNPKAYWSALLKANIQKDLGDFKGAMLTAEAAKKAAVEGENTGYAQRADELINSLKSKK